MTTHLISLLGLPRTDPSGDRKYRTIPYRFPDGHLEVTPTFGLALAAWFRCRRKAPLTFDRVLWLGTASCAWGSLLQTVLGDEAVEQDLFLELFDGQNATQAQLDRLAGLLSARTRQRQECRLIPPCADPEEQGEFVTLLTGELAPRDRVVLDLTHGLRNQSLMLAQSALMLEGAFGVTIEGLFYGGFEIPREANAPAPAVDLTGLLVQARLAQALAAFRQSGDLRTLVQHLPAGGFRTQMENLGHAVAIHDYTQARSLASLALAALPGAGVGVLEAALGSALQTFRARGLAESQYQQAEEHLNRKDFFRATLELFEGAVTRACQRLGLESSDPEDRIRRAVKAMRELDSDDWKALIFLRNQMAHGVATDWHGLMKLAKHPVELEALLRRLLIVIPELVEGVGGRP